MSDATDSIDVTHFVAGAKDVRVQLHLLNPSNMDKIAELMRPCVESAYKQTFNARFLKAGYFALTITAKEEVVATSAAYWLPCPANTFETRFESVLEEQQRKGYGTMLFHTLQMASLYLAKNDPWIALNLLGYDKLSIHAYVDYKEETDPTYWHKGMMEKYGYKEIDINDDDNERLMELVLEL
jgi:hypothetical protein